MLLLKAFLTLVSIMSDGDIPCTICLEDLNDRRVYIENGELQVRSSTNNYGRIRDNNGRAMRLRYYILSGRTLRERPCRNRSRQHGWVCSIDCCVHAYHSICLSPWLSISSSK